LKFNATAHLYANKIKDKQNYAGAIINELNRSRENKNQTKHGSEEPLKVKCNRESAKAIVCAYCGSYTIKIVHDSKEISAFINRF